MDTKTFGDRLAQARLMRGWSQTDLGKAADMAPTQVSRYEAGRATPRGLTLGRLASSLGVRPEWLVTGLGDVESGRSPSSLPSGNERMVEFSIMFTDDERRHLEAGAASQGVTLEQFIRMAMRDAMEVAQRVDAAEKAEGKPQSFETLEREIEAQRDRLEEMAAVIQKIAPEAMKAGDARPAKKEAPGLSFNLQNPESMRPKSQASGTEAKPKKKA
jgi:transcriptional regulator with XRE-family HTH domain